MSILDQLKSGQLPTVDTEISVDQASLNGLLVKGAIAVVAVAAIIILMIKLSK